MRLMGDNNATRIHGTLTATLEDGREAQLEIDIDVSDPRSFVEVQNHYDDQDRIYPSVRPARVLSQTLSIHWPAPPHPLRGEEPPAPLTIRVPLP